MLLSKATYIAFKLQFYILSAVAFPGNRTHDLGVASAMLYQLSYRKAVLEYLCGLNSSARLQVVYNVGLCVCLYDITKLEDSYIFPGDGASHTKGDCSSLRSHRDRLSPAHPHSLSPPAVHFRYVVFHPFLDEILVGKIKGCSAEGVHGKRGRKPLLVFITAGVIIFNYK